MSPALAGRHTFSWTTYIATEFTTIKPKLKPDGIFSIKKKSRSDALNFCLEIDRGTMPIRSTHLERSSILKKYKLNPQAF